jgi:hypothetical protein
MFKIVNKPRCDGLENVLDGSKMGSLRFCEVNLPTREEKYSIRTALLLEEVEPGKLAPKAG